MSGKNLAGKNIVIIGGTTGLGLSAAKAFVENGAHVVVVGRNEDSAIEAKKLLDQNVEVISADAVQTSTAIHAIQHCIGKF